MDGPEICTPPASWPWTALQSPPLYELPQATTPSAFMPSAFSAANAWSAEWTACTLPASWPWTAVALLSSASCFFLLFLALSSASLFSSSSFFLCLLCLCRILSHSSFSHSLAPRAGRRPEAGMMLQLPPKDTGHWTLLQSPPKDKWP
jgi:hypothetical protein